MAEPMPRLTPEVVDLAWEAAQASNNAFDALHEAEANITKVQEVARLAVAGVSINGEAFDALEQERADAQTNFDLLSDMASPVMVLPDSPFATNSTEIAPVIVPEVDAETAKQLEVLPTDYRTSVVTRYAEASDATARHIKDGTLSETHQLPELSTMVERVVALAPTHEAMQKKGWQPEVVFIPEGLSFEQWHGLLSGHELKSGYKSEGAWRSWGDYANSLTDPTVKETNDKSVWDVAIVSATDRPVLVNVSPDGANGSNAKKAVKTLAELPSVTDASNPEAVVKQLSPSQDAYFSLQLARLERGEQPVDAETWTIGKENITVDGEVQSLCFYWYPDYRRVYSYWYDRDGSGGGGGVRPSVRGKDLVLGSQS